MDITEYIEHFRQGKFLIHYIPFVRRLSDKATVELAKKALISKQCSGNTASFVSVGLHLSGCTKDQINHFIEVMGNFDAVKPIKEDLSFIHNVGVFKPVEQPHGFIYELVIPAFTTDDGETWNYKLYDDVHFDEKATQIISFAFNQVMDRIKYRRKTSMFTWDFRKWGYYKIVDGKLKLERVYMATNKSLKELEDSAKEDYQRVLSARDTQEITIEMLREEVATLKRRLDEKETLPPKKRRGK